MASHFGLQRRDRYERKRPETDSHADFLANEGLIPPGRSATCLSSKRDSTYGNQRCAAKRSQASLVAAHLEPAQSDQELRTSVALSQRTIASSKKSRFSTRNKFALIFGKSSDNEREDLYGTSADEERKESRLLYQHPKRWFGGSRWIPRVKGTNHAVQRNRIGTETERSNQTARCSTPPDFAIHGPILDFGAVPGAGYEKSSPRVDLSSGAAARAAAAAQNGLMENLRKMRLHDDHSVQDSESGVGIETGENRNAFVVPLIRSGGTDIHSALIPKANEVQTLH